MVQTRQKTECSFIPTATSNYTARVYTWRNRVRSDGRNERLELYVEKSTCTVLRGGGHGNMAPLTRLGYLHSSFYGRPALALDLMEEFRPVIVDSVVLTLLNNRMFTVDDFVVELGAYRLKDERRKVFFTKLEERLNEEVTHPLFGYQVTYRRCLELQVRLLAKVLTGEIDEYPPLLSK